MSTPLFSRNGESIIALSGSAIRLWRTKGSTTPPPSVLTQTPPNTGIFAVDFSPDRMFAAVARKYEKKTVEVLSLKSGVPQLTIDADMEVCGLKLSGNAVTVIGGPKIVTWDLPTGDHAPNAIVTLEDSARIINFESTNRCRASISSDSCYIATVGVQPIWSYLELYDGSTGEWLGRKGVGSATPWFAPGGREIWLTDANDGEKKVFRVNDVGRRLEDVTHKVDVEDPPEGYPWKSSRGYRVTNDWWILGPSGERLLMLPPLWQSTTKSERVWNGQFLALVQGGPTKPVILELL